MCVPVTMIITTTLVQVDTLASLASFDTTSSMMSFGLRRLRRRDVYSVLFGVVVAKVVIVIVGAGDDWSLSVPRSTRAP